MPGGRPQYKWSSQLEEKICASLSKGDSLRTICALQSMPSQFTVFKHLHENEQFAKQYARAREIQAENYAAEIIAISDETPTCEVPDPDGGVSVRVDAAGVQRNKLRVDARKWIACKLLPKIYGDKLAHTGADGDGPVELIVKHIGSDGE